MFRLALFCALALPLVASAQQPAPVSSPDYKKLYEQANDAAAKWKTLADARGKELEALRKQPMLQAAPASPNVARAIPTPSAEDLRPGATVDASGVVHVPFQLPPKRHVHLVDFGGPNEFMTFLSADPLAIHLRIGVGTGNPVNIPVRRGFQGSDGSRTEVYNDGHGCSVYYLDDTRGSGCSFEATYQPGTPLPPKQVGYTGNSTLKERMNGTAPKTYTW